MSPRATAPNPSHSRLRETVWLMVLVLTLINLLNYVDRFIITALLPAIQRDLSLSDTQGGFLGSSFIIVYMIASPVFGWLGDRGVRKVWLAVGVGLWSVATGLGGVARGFPSLLAARSTIGIGEAAYGTISPAVIADLVPKSRRGRVMAIFFFAIPAGSALGYLLGGLLGPAVGWRHAFFVVGFPGLLLAAVLLALVEPRRGGQDGAEAPSPLGFLARYRSLASSRVYVWNVLGYVAYTFAIGGLAFWTPSYLMRVRAFPEGKGMLIFGGITVVTGIIGTLGGGFLGDKLQARSPNGYTALNIVSVLAGSVLALAALLSSGSFTFLALLALAELCLFASTAPVNALIVNTVPPSLRATASGTAIFAIHLGGDAISPTLIGVIADHAGLASGMLLIPAFFLLAGALWAGTYQRPTPAAAAAPAA